MYLMGAGEQIKEGASPRGPPGEELAPSQQEAGQRPEGIGVPPMASTAVGGGCNKVHLCLISCHPDKEQRTVQLPTSTPNADEGNILIGGDVPEWVVVLVLEVDLDPPGTGSGKM
jgi:hypothetical protein